MALQFAQLSYWKHFRPDFYEVLKKHCVSFHEDDGEISLSFLARNQTSRTHKDDVTATSNLYVTTQVLRSTLKDLHPSFYEVSLFFFCYQTFPGSSFGTQRKRYKNPRDHSEIYFFPEFFRPIFD